ncbi:3-hydroxyisobutyryl-CoA hydrolase-like protein 5 [Zostera marina]|uniref:3-hydroxyisobutyryl-CoA hydrolase n=1 Tax=Zostera marina TaxID=29655 RepID=A0A0K9NN10_ZOSMR|nr:3-hydroxyisobutyryl-CoA hydrolase-like protein 5 [Zostera marina]
MAKEAASSDQGVVIGEEINQHVRLLTLNRPKQLNCISSETVSLLAEFLEKWERDDNVRLIVIKGMGRAFSAGGDLRMFYNGGSGDSCLDVVYRMYWLCYHLHTYKKTRVALVHGIAMGGGAAISVPSEISVVTEKTIFAVPEASVGLHTDCSFSYILSRLPGHLGEFLALTGATLNGKEMIDVGLATHFVPSEKLPELEKRLLDSDTGDKDVIRTLVDDYSSNVRPDEESVLNKLETINKCFSASSVEEIIISLKAEAVLEGNEWMGHFLKGLKRASPTGLKITLRSIREGRQQTLPECLKKEFRLSMNILRSLISSDVFEGIRALSIDKDNAPKWNPKTLDEVTCENLDLVFQAFTDELELKLPYEAESCRWEEKYENTVYSLKQV